MYPIFLLSSEGTFGRLHFPFAGKLWLYIVRVKHSTLLFLSVSLLIFVEHASMELLWFIVFCFLCQKLMTDNCISSVIPVVNFLENCSRYVFNCSCGNILADLLFFYIFFFKNDSSTWWQFVNSALRTFLVLRSYLRFPVNFIGWTQTKNNYYLFL